MKHKKDLIFRYISRDCDLIVVKNVKKKKNNNSKNVNKILQMILGIVLSSTELAVLFV